MVRTVRLADLVDKGSRAQSILCSTNPAMRNDTDAQRGVKRKKGVTVFVKYLLHLIRQFLCKKGSFMRSLVMRFLKGEGVFMLN